VRHIIAVIHFLWTGLIWLTIEADSGRCEDSNGRSVFREM